MAIWKNHYTLEELEEHGRNTMVEWLGIKITEIGEDYLVATMPVDHRTHQPLQLLHGGASVVLAETVGSVAANLMVQPGHYCLGLDINANHLRGVGSGLVHATARPIHVGRTTHVWDIRINDDNDQPVCISRLTMAVIQAK
ncbi:MAG: esterase [Verrucomicrobiaceae bacterium]|nr:esterase [Verrucomicrobiaceae bacterium]